jgi:hypothetical protein
MKGKYLRNRISRDTKEIIDTANGNSETANELIQERNRRVLATQEEINKIKKEADRKNRALLQEDEEETFC